MKRCGREDLHDPHGDCDGRTTNEAMVGVLTVRELREILDSEQGGAVVAIRDGDTFRPLRVPSGPQGKPVFFLEPFE